MSTMSAPYHLRIIRVEDLYWYPLFHNQVPDVYVLYKLGNTTGMTLTIKQSLSPVWNASFVFPFSEDLPPLVIEVKHESTWSKDPCIGRAEIGITDLLARCALGPGEVSLNISRNHNRETICTGRIILRLDVVDMQAGARISLARAEEDIRHGKFMRYAGVSDVTQSIGNRASQLSTQGDLYQAVGALITRLDAFKQAMTMLSEIHPFLTIAWKLATALYSAVQKVFDNDLKVVNLVLSMEDAFSFVRDVHSLPNMAVRLQQTIVGLLKQTIECCIFVSHYTSRRFLKRMLDITSSQKIDEFEKSLANFKQQIEGGVILHTATVVSGRMTERIDEELLRQRLNPSLSEAFSRPSCLPDTRVEVRQEILDWIFSETEPNIFWLHGVAGSGKSTVSTTIAQHVRDMSRLGAFLFFERGKSEPSSVIRTIAYKLALFDSSIGTSILSETDNDKDISSMLPIDQFTKLLERPLADVSTKCPIVVILDALDECGTSGDRDSLTRLLGTELPKLPKNFRFLITSRREPDIDKALSSQQENVRIMELDYMSTSSQQDVLSFLRVEMYKAVTSRIDIPSTYGWDESLCSLSAAAGGLFIWASTAIKLVSNSDNPFPTFKDLVADSRSLSGLGLGELYATVLRNSGITWAKDSSKSRFVGVLSLLLFGKVALSCDTIDGILGFPLEESSDLVLSRLRCLLSYSRGEPVRLYHASVGDYLTAHEHSNEPWYISHSVANRLILDRCFTVMKNMLHFNMCSLETSFVRNADVPELENRIETHVPMHLKYACIHWVQHLHDIPFTLDMLNVLDNFAKNYLLFWFEVLSLVKEFGRIASSALARTSELIETNSSDLATFLRDAADLTITFATPIVESTPHIYVTMIPLSKDESVVSAHYSAQMSFMVEVQRMGSKRPLRSMRVLEGHSGRVNSVSISRDGRLIASGSQKSKYEYGVGDGTIRIWDFYSGKEVKVMKGYGEDCGGSIAFLPDGQHVISFSSFGGLKIWDIQTGELDLRPLQGYNKSMGTAVSPDGRKVAARGRDGVVIVWNVSDGTELTRFAGGATKVDRLTFSDDGMFLLSDDGTVRVWNVANRRLVSGPFKIDCFASDWVSYAPLSRDAEHIVIYEALEVRMMDVESQTVKWRYGPSDLVCSIAYSPCGTRIAVGCEDGVVTVLNARTGEVVSGPFEGHAGQIRSISFSPDARHVISGSWDETVRIWDTTVGHVNSDTVTTESDYSYVAISDDGSTVALYSDDDLTRSIIVWDARSGDVISGPFNVARVDCMMFSPDSSRLIAELRDEIRLWDVKTGESVFDIRHPHERYFICVAVSPDSTCIVSGDYGGTVMVWSMATGQLIYELFQTDMHEIACLEFSPDGARLAAVHRGTITVWSTATWQVTCECPAGHDDDHDDDDYYDDCIESIRIRFSPDGTQIASLSQACDVTLIDVEKSCIIFGHWKSNHCFHDLVFIPNGLHVVSRINNDILIDKIDAEGICSIYQLHEIPGKFTFECSRNGSRIVSSSVEGVVRVWDTCDLFHSSTECEAGGVVSVPEWRSRDDGWLVDGDDGEDLLIWVPRDLRRTIRPPRVTVLNAGSSTMLDFTNAALGDRWTQCFTPSRERALT